MKITVIQFSPSGNTEKITRFLVQKLTHQGHQVQLLDITGNAAYLNHSDKQAFLQQNVLPHDILLIGGPVYAHHLQYRVLELIEALPQPDGTWGRIAIPYVTYGGMTRAFMPEEYNHEKLQGEEAIFIDELVNRIGQLNLAGKIKGIRKSLQYNGLKTALLAKLVFVEKAWHAKRYPKVVINSNNCTACGKCVTVCPVAHLQKEGKTIVPNPASDCIHCLNCVRTCPAKAVSLSGDLEKGKAFMTKMITKQGNREKPESAVYPLLQN